MNFLVLLVPLLHGELVSGRMVRDPAGHSRRRGSALRELHEKLAASLHSGILALPCLQKNAS
jgi:hypothetical protein